MDLGFVRDNRYWHMNDLPLRGMRPRALCAAAGGSSFWKIVDRCAGPISRMALAFVIHVFASWNLVASSTRTAQARATRSAFHPRSAGFSEKAKPGSEGMTTSKASLVVPPCAVGSVSGPITCRKRRIVLGHPCVSTMGSALGCCDRT
jgi:hypothetical protein